MSEQEKSDEVLNAVPPETEDANAPADNNEEQDANLEQDGNVANNDGDKEDKPPSDDDKKDETQAEGGEGTEEKTEGAEGTEEAAPKEEKTEPPPEEEPKTVEEAVKRVTFSIPKDCVLTETEELLVAKTFLMKNSIKTDTNTYDHMSQIIMSILDSKIENAVGTINIIFIVITINKKTRGILYNEDVKKFLFIIKYLNKKIARKTILY